MSKKEKIQKEIELIEIDKENIRLNFQRNNTMVSIFLGATITTFLSFLILKSQSNTIAIGLLVLVVIFVFVLLFIISVDTKEEKQIRELNEKKRELIKKK